MAASKLRRLVNLLLYKGYSFEFLEFSEPRRVLRWGDEVVFHGRVRNNGLHRGTFYVVIRIADPYRRRKPVFHSDRDLTDNRKRTLRILETMPGDTADFAFAWEVPQALQPGPYYVQFELWNPPKLFRRRNLRHYPWCFARSPWFGWLEVLVPMPRPSGTRPPRVFVSYAWTDSGGSILADHRAWVLKLVDELTRHDLEVVIDKYRLSVGDDLLAVIRREIEICDCYVLICSSWYTAKANALEGGVGEETKIFASSSYFSSHREQFIPIVRDNHLKGERLPTYLGNLLYQDMDSDSEDWRAGPLLRVVRRIEAIRADA